MAKKIEMLNDRQQVVHPLTSSDCVIMENGKTLEEVMGDGIATPTVTHEGASFQVGVGDSNIEVVDGDVAGMTLEGQTYQNILPKPTTLIMETDEKEFKINDKIDNNIVLDDNVAEIATIKGQTYVNTVQEESASEYIAIGEELNGQSITTTGKPEGYVKNATLEGLTLVNTIQEPSGADATVLELDADIDAQYATIDNTVQGGIHGAILKGQTLVNILDCDAFLTANDFPYTYDGKYFTNPRGADTSAWAGMESVSNLIKPNTNYFFILSNPSDVDIIFESSFNNSTSNIDIVRILAGTKRSYKRMSPNDYNGLYAKFYSADDSVIPNIKLQIMILEYQEGMENWDIPYFEGMQSVEVPSVKTTGKNLFDGEFIRGKINDDGTNSEIESMARSKNYIEVKPNTTYNYKWIQMLGASRIFFYDNNKQFISKGDSIPNNGGNFTTPNNCKYILFHLGNANNFGSDTVQIEEGSTATTYEPYQSSTVTAIGELLPILETEQDCYYSAQGGNKFNNPDVDTVKYKVQGLSKVYVKVAHSNFSYWDANNTYISGQATIVGSSNNAKGYLDIPSNAVYMKCAVMKNKIAEVYEPVTLRKVGNVQDELDLETGKLTQRIGEVTLLGGNNISLQSDFENQTNTIGFSLVCNNGLWGEGLNSTSLSNYFRVYNQTFLHRNDIEGISQGYKRIYVRVNRDKLNTQDVTGFKLWLSQNPITVQYTLETPIIRQVDLSIVDQDNNSVKSIQTHPTLTHVSTSSQGLIPNIVIPSQLKYPTIIKPSTTYTVQLKHTTVNSNNPLTINLGGTTMAVPSTKFTITTPSELTSQDAIFTGKNNVIGEVVITEGDTTGVEYDFFEGMNDVKFSDSKFIARGKNLLDLSKVIEDKALIVTSGELVTNALWDFSDFIPIDVTKQYYGQNILTGSSNHGLGFYDKNKNYILGANYGGPFMYLTVVRENDFVLTRFPEGACYVRFNIKTTLEKYDEAMFFEGVEPLSSYEPYKGVTIEQDVDSIPLTSSMFEQNTYVTSNAIKGMSLQQIPTTTGKTNRIRSKTLIKVKPNATYQTLSSDIAYSGVAYFDKNGAYIGVVAVKTNNEFKTDSNTHYIALNVKKSDDSNITPSSLDSLNLILQEVADEIVLRSLPNGVKDTLNLTTGEYVQRIGEVVLDGSEDEQLSLYTRDSFTNVIGAYILTRNNCDRLSSASIISDKFVSRLGADVANIDEEGIYARQDLSAIYIKINKTKLNTQDVNGFKQYFQQNPLTIQYELELPIITKVNLTNTTKLPSYASTTHYDTIVSSNSLVPNIKIPSTIDYNVAIKPSTQYTIRANTTSAMSVNLGGSTGTLSNGKVTLTTPSALAHNSLKLGNGKAKEVMVIEGSEIKDNVPFFNGMKNVQMGGIKLVNIARGATCSALVTANTNKTQFTYTGDGSSWGHIVFDESLLKRGTVYTIFMKVITNQSDNATPIKIQIGSSTERTMNVLNGFTGIYSQVQRTPTKFEIGEDIKRFTVSFRPCTSGQQVVIENPMIIEGNWTHLDEIPYVESEMIIEQPIIRSQGKNLFHIDGKELYSENNLHQIQNNDVIMENTIYGYYNCEIKYFNLKPNKNYILSYNTEILSGTPYVNAIVLDEQKNTLNNNNGMFTVPSNGKIRIKFYSGSDTKMGKVRYYNIQLEEGSTATSYEPFKQHTLSSNRVIGYEENCFYGGTDGTKITTAYFNSVMADVEGLSIAYVKNGSTNFSFWDKDMIFISGKSYLDTSLSSDNKNGFIQVPSNAKYMKFASANTIGSATDYTKATVTGELPLRSLPNGVCDSFNLVTGEYVQRVGEVILDGSEVYQTSVMEAWINTNGVADSFGAICYLRDNSKLPLFSFTEDVSHQNIKCDKFAVSARKDSEITKNTNVIVGGGNGAGNIYLGFKLKTSDYRDIDSFKVWLSQNPVTIQYTLATPIVRKIGLTAKGNYKEIELNGSERVAQNPEVNKLFHIYNLNLANDGQPYTLFTNKEQFTITNSLANYTMYKYTDGSELVITVDENINTLDLFKRWLSQNSVKISHLTNNSASLYSNIQKPIFFNNVKVQFMNDNVDIQPTLTLQSRSRNSYVMDMMKANTTYTLKALNNSSPFTIDGTSYNATTNGTFTSPSTLTNKLLITGQDVQELMIIDGDVTGKTIPYYKGIRSSFDNTDKVEVYSVNKNLLPKEFINRCFGENVKQITRVCSKMVECKPNTVYTVYNIPSDIYTDVYVEYANDYAEFNETVTTSRISIASYGKRSKITFTTPIGYKYMAIYIFSGSGFSEDGYSYKNAKISLCLGTLDDYIYQQHQHNTTSLPMPTRLETVEVVKIDMLKDIELGAINTGTGANGDSTSVKRLIGYIPVEPKQTLYFTNGSSYRAMNVLMYDIDKNFIKYQYTNGTGDVTTSDNCYFVRFYFGLTNIDNLTLIKKQYKPIALNSLPNGIKDEIIIEPTSNKAKLIQRVGKAVLDGGEDWILNVNNTIKFNSYCNGFNSKPQTTVISDKLISIMGDEVSKITTSTVEGFSINLLKSEYTSVVDLSTFKKYLQQNPITVYYELAEPVITEISLKGYPYVYKDGSVQLNTEIPHTTKVKYNVNQEHLINGQNETIIRHDKQIDNLYDYIELYLEEEYRMELFRMQLELSL